MRHSGSYAKWRSYFARVMEFSPEQVEVEAARRLRCFLRHVTQSSKWYRSRGGMSLGEFPILEKTDILAHLDQIATIDGKNAVVSLTGGTTGSSMKVYYTKEDVQERNALLDHFRESYGYKLGERVAWFSGKDLVRERDIKKGLCYRDDFFNKVRFFSTFHINARTFPSYWSALEQYRPRFMVGFPSSIYDLAVLANEHGLRASFDVKAIFPTAETVTPAQREVIGAVFGARLLDQYASSEGAPFILECANGRLHIHPLSGVIEVVGEDGRPALEGEMIVTSFSTRGTPLVRYRIGDRIRLAEAGRTCSCGSPFPLVEWIDGRTSDFIWSAERGRINLGNLSNVTKEVSGIQCFQVTQDELDRIEVSVVGGSGFDEAQERALLAALRARTGERMEILIKQVERIERERSGKFRIVKNSIAGRIAIAPPATAIESSLSR